MIHEQTVVSWSTFTDEHARFASGETRGAAIEAHLRSNRDMKQAITDLAMLGPLAPKWQNYQFPPIRGVRRTVTVTRTEITETVDTYDLPLDAFGWDRDGSEIVT